MDCSEFLKTIQPFYDGALDAGRAAEMERHRSGCLACGAKMERLRALDEVVRRKWRVPTSESIESRVMLAVAARRIERARSRWWAAAALAASVLLAVGAVLWHGSQATHAPEVARAISGSSNVTPDEKLSSPDNPDARSLYYRGIELFRNGDIQRARMAFQEIEAKYPQCGFAGPSAFYEAMIEERGLGAEAMDEATLRGRLAAWLKIPVEALSDTDAERTLYFRARYAHYVFEKTRARPDLDTARLRAQDYARRFPGRSGDVESWLRD